MNKVIFLYKKVLSVHEKSQWIYLFTWFQISNPCPYSKTFLAEKNEGIMQAKWLMFCILLHGIHWYVEDADAIVSFLLFVCDMSF